MLRRTLAAVVVMFVLGGFVLAETYRGVITEVSKDKVKISVGGKKGEKAEPKEFKVSSSVKVSKRKGKDEAEDSSIEAVTEAIKGAKGKLKGVFATIETEGSGDNETVTKISFGGGGRGKKKD